MSQEAQPQVGQDPAAQATPVAEPVATPPAVQPQSQGHPWDTDLSFIPDESVRSQVSDYLASTWQPRVTQIEQSSKQALDLYNDFGEKPKDTLVDVAEELYGKDVATAFRQYLDEVEGSPDPATTQPQATAEGQPQRDPEVQALIDKERAREEQEAFDAEFARVKEANPGIPFDRNLYMAEVAQTGDFDVAVQTYTTNHSDYIQFLQSQQAAENPAPADPPPTLGSGEATGAAEVQTETQNPTLHEAIDDFAQELAARGQSFAPSSPAPPVATG